MVICSFFAKGYCARGSDCRYKHVEEGLESQEEQRPAAVIRPAHPKPVCTFYAQGRCRNGAQCHFEHVGNGLVVDGVAAAFQSLTLTANGAEVEHVAQATAGADTRAAVVCRFFQAGECRNDSCPYLHLGQDSEVDTQREDIDDDQHQDNFVREFGGARVQFTSGAQMDKLALPSDFSAVRLSGLPVDSTAQDAITTLVTIGFEVALHNIRISVDQHENVQKAAADIKVEDPTFARRLTTRLAEDTQSGFRATIAAVPLFSGMNRQRVDSTKVLCSWHKATRTAWLNFGTSGIAIRVRNKFKNGRYQILGSKFSPEEPTRAGGLRNRQAWTLKLQNVPAAAAKHDIEQAISDEHDKPRNVELSVASSLHSDDAAADMVIKMLHAIGPIETTDYTADTGSKRVKMRVRFQIEADAARAAKELHMKPLPFGSGKLTAQAVHSAKFKIATHIYKAVRETIQQTALSWGTQARLSIFTGSPQTRYMTVKLEGEDAKGVAAARNDLRKILEGRVACKGGVPLWTSSLSGNGALFQKVKEIQDITGAVIVREKSKHQLRLYGSEAVCLKAQAALSVLVQTDESASRVIELKPDEFTWACQGGFRSIQARFGEHMTTFDVVSVPKRIVLTGTAEDFNLAQAMVKNCITTVNTKSTVDGDCTVCWTDAEVPIQTNCGHVYCMECFENMCVSTGSGGQDLSIVCQGDSGACQHVFTLPELQEHLSSTALEDVLKLSFDMYVRRRPADFKYCPTADCEQIYRSTAEGTTITCSECFTSTCTACHSSHSGVSCAEFKYLASGEQEAVDKFKKEHGMKDCPKCKTTMEKTEGCNHMQCGGCKIHLCWVCLATFEGSKPCYAHLTEQHGGIFTVPLGMLDY